MTDRELLYIKTIIEEKSITKAAQKLYVAQPSLSQAVRRVEESLALKLFIRTPNGMKPTQAGDEYYKVAVEILKKYDSFKSMILEEDDLNCGKITFGLTTRISNILPKVLPGFISKYPGIELNIREDYVANVRAMLITGEINFAILHMDVVDDIREKFDLMHIANDEIIIFASPNHQLIGSATHSFNRRFPVVNLAEMIKYPLIQLYGGGPFRTLYEKLLADVGVHEVRTLLVTHNISTAIQLALTGVGITICPCLSIPDDISEGCAMSFPEGCDSILKLYAAYPENSYKTKAEMALFDYLVESLRQ